MRIVTLAALLLAGCATKAPPLPSITLIEASLPPDPCSAETMSLLGKPVTSALVADAVRLTGSRSARTIRPDSMVTMDYRSDRVNLKVDVANVVTAISCY